MFNFLNRRTKREFDERIQKIQQERQDKIRELEQHRQKERKESSTSFKKSSEPVMQLVDYFNTKHFMKQEPDTTLTEILRRIDENQAMTQELQNIIYKVVACENRTISNEQMQQISKELVNYYQKCAFSYLDKTEKEGEEGLRKMMDIFWEQKEEFDKIQREIIRK